MSMKTTIELPDSLLAAAKANARARKITLRAVVMEGLESVLERERRPARPFKLKDFSQDLGEPQVKSWPEIRALIYEGRGGEE